MLKYDAVNFVGNNQAIIIKRLTESESVLHKRMRRIFGLACSPTYVFPHGFHQICNLALLYFFKARRIK